MKKEEMKVLSEEEHKKLVEGKEIVFPCCFCWKGVGNPITVNFALSEDIWQVFFCCKKCIKKVLHKKASCELREELI